MSKLKIALLLTLLLGLIVSAAAFAGGFKVVTYEDTSATIKQASKTVTTPQYIYNGDFMYWDSMGYPDGWNVPTPVLSPGWSVHFANVDLTDAGTREGGMPPDPAAPADPNAIGYNRGSGYFFRTGSSGSQFAGMSQQVSPNLAGGDYWVQVHMTAWESYVKSAYNSVAWYGFGETADSSSVKEWRELFPDTYACDNGAATCNYLGRKETVSIKPGAYFHLQMGMKFPDHNAWTVFVVDDISISDFSDGIEVDVTDFTDDGDVRWDSRAER